jgi:ubiquinone biosynthesis protein
MRAIEILLSLPIAVLASWAIGRLLGVARTWRALVAIGIAGWTLGTALSAQLTAGSGATLDQLATKLLLASVSIVLINGALALFRRYDGRANAARNRGIPHPIRSVRATWLRSRRYSQVARIALKNGFGPHLSHKRRSADAFTAPNYGYRLRLALEESGGMFVKLGQLLSTRSDLLSPEAITEMTRLQDHVSPVPPEAIQALVEQELGGPLSNSFLHFDLEPIAAASIGQVHAASLLDGRAVVVKVQRPGVDELVERDIDALLRLARSVERRAAWAASYQIVALAEDLAGRLREELDYRIEATNTAVIAQNLGKDPVVRVPAIHEALSTRRVLTLQRFHGVSIREDGEIERRGFDRRAIADNLVACYIRQLLIDGFFNADPHPGNILLLEEQQIGLIDFGAVGRLDAIEQEALKGVIIGIAARDPEAVLTAILEIVDIPVNADLGKLQHALGSLLAHQATEPSPAAFTALLRTFSAYGIAVPGEFGTLFRTLATLQGTVETLSPGYPFAERAQSLASGVFGSSLESPLRMDGLVKSELVAVLPQLRRLPRHVDRIATLAERGDLRFRVSLFSTPEDVRSVTLLINRIILAGLGIGIALVGTTLLRTPAGPVLAEGPRLYALLGCVCLAASMILVVRVTTAVMRDGLN